MTMKVYIVTDMEGISLVYAWNQVKQGHPFYESYRSVLTQEVNAAVEAAAAAGATDIVVNDGHGSEDYNLLCERLPEYVRIERPDSGKRILPSLDESFHSLLLIGYHAMEGTADAVLPHTQNAEKWLSYHVNGKLYGEIGQMSLIAGAFAVPVAYISGDAAAVREARELHGEDLPATAVKRGWPGGKAVSLHPAESARRIRAEAERALRAERRKPLAPEGPAPYRVEVAFKSVQAADAYAHRPGVERTGPAEIARTVARADEILDL